jgi:hypothetical protein
MYNNEPGMKKAGTVTLPLHYGRAPTWLFQRMKSLAREIIIAIVTEFGAEDFLKKISDPYWFQCLGCVLGFDWHSSGLTTTTTGAVKEGLKGLEREIGVFVAGGKGRAARKTIDELKESGNTYGMEVDHLIYSSRIAAKVDSAAVQDGFQLYHHAFFYTLQGQWTVVQQGMSEGLKMARRYHWLGDGVGSFVLEPHSAICSERRSPSLNLVHRESNKAQSLITELSARPAERNVAEMKKLAQSVDGLYPSVKLPFRHHMTLSDMHPERLYKILLKTYEHDSGDFEELLGIEGVGAKTLRALSLVAELIYGVSPSFSDPARFSFAVGGKDGIPYPVDVITYDQTVEVMKQAIEKAKVGNREKMDAVRRLMAFTEH